MEKKKRNNATVTFSRKEQKEEMLQYLNSVQLQNLMPDNVKGKDCKMVLWAVEYLHRLAVDGKIRVQVPMYEEDSQEKQGMIDEIARLKAEIKQLQSMPFVVKIMQQGNTINTLEKDIEAKNEKIENLEQDLKLAQGGETNFVETINSLVEENRRLKVQLHL